MDIYLTPAKRSDMDEILREYKQVKSIDHAQQILDAMPCLSVVVNKNRQIVYANKALMSLLGVEQMENILGLRPGELICCIHSHETQGGCGTAEACRHCGAANSIFRSLDTRLPQQGECFLTSDIDGQLIPFEFQVATSPFAVTDGDFYVIVTLTDISAVKRKQMLERTFLHDLSNKTSNLNGLAYRMKEADAEGKLGELTDILFTVTDTINDEITSYRQLINAESNNLLINILDTSAFEMIDVAIKSVQFLESAKDKVIITDMMDNDVRFQTDISLLQRVLLNMLKNAVEASWINDRITIGFTADINSITFFVHNKQVIPQDVANMVFKRSFSTKDSSRGIGTYSMKLFGERYLKGRVGFTSSEKAGTRFYITLPL